MANGPLNWGLLLIGLLKLRQEFRLAEKGRTVWAKCRTGIPKFRANDGVLTTRFIYIGCPSTLYRREDRDLPANLMGKLEILLRWAVDGWQPLQKTNRFTETKTHSNLNKWNEVQMNPVGM